MIPPPSHPSSSITVPPPAASTVDLTEALATLQADREAISWPQRRGIVARIAGPLTEGKAGEPFRSLLLLLAEDPKWEVRRDVAEALEAIPDLELAGLAERMLDDSHSYVQRAAKDAIQRRTKRLRAAQKRKRGLDLVNALEADLVDKYGAGAATKARQIAEHRYDLLVGATVHEMRAVLTTLKHTSAALMGLTKNGAFGDGAAHEKCQLLVDRLAFLERLLLDMREYTYPVPEERVVLTVADLVTEARSMVSENLRARGISGRKVTLEINVPPQLEVQVARYPIVLALVNILKNAYEALPATPDGPEGRIGIVARRHEKRLQIVITDSGPGIPEASLAQIREFFTGRTTKKGYGTGFGLSCAARNLKAHGGNLSIASALNVGTTVTLELPLPLPP